jgi:hypothetical protein
MDIVLRDCMKWYQGVAVACAGLDEIPCEAARMEPAQPLRFRFLLDAVAKAFPR